MTCTGASAGARTRPYALALVGATAAGKSALGEALARALDAEVVCCDSRQVFAELEIGTGKPSPAERAARPHHLFDTLRVGDHASAGWFARAAGEACAGIRERGRLPLLVGGSGLYLQALQEGLAPTPPHDPDVRRRLRAELEALGPEALHARLVSVDPESAARLAPRDRQRIGRALEVHEITGKPLSWWHARTTAAPQRERWAVLEILVDRKPLQERIARRTAWMFADGLIEETRTLLDRGVGDALRTLRAIGYDEAMDVIAGRLDRAAAEARVNRRTAQLAKRQRTWFRHRHQGLSLEATGVDPASPIVVTFSHAIMPGMEEYAALHEGDVTGPVVVGTWTWSANRTQLTFTPAARLKAETQYTLHIGGGMRDAMGNPINYEYCLGHGGRWATQQMMGNQNMMGSGWRNGNGTYGMVFTFTTAWI